ncbi:uncharacterized protein Z520_05711 [Fonsecaea multimorphosa CBS 102226]|uniref:Uncharacterized protein n=1 Tax=Fonsecaea multimorphosa CBS 102226 TaxID=1442371 RepID=A0A0D2H9A2_9EURO|nr:uncharacterized protein Z520_05711 [Fonsecaea multimorphosa CBS 102226]KIX98410.1 hypothetical protein Z520_05711 [Fonsecaea multimorphosa CBS 102226]OAL24604.1 hypothetical protein AYO22_05393 [Fonsecaea multimorphosa]
MPSQGCQNLSQSSPLCLPLLKFSYATVSNESIAPIPWIHLSSKDALFAIFETSPVQLEHGRIEERQKFKVLQDPEVMEELDLNALSVEAHRALIQTPNATTAGVAHVAIIVKVPIIAIKYPMPNGQIRRFQIRFSKNEDYYEAMKMLSRANVPTVEAGTFPAHKPQAAARPVAPNLVAPSDSASQIGLSMPSPRKYAANDDMSALSLSRPATSGHSAMPPPQMFLAPAQSAQYPLNVRPPPDRDLRTAQAPDLGPAYPKSNISLSTATTLVPDKQQLRLRAMQNQSEFEDVGNIRSRQSTRTSPYFPGLETSRGNISLGLRGGQLASPVTRSEVNNHSYSLHAGGTGGPVLEEGQSDSHLRGGEADSVLSKTTTAKGRAKRSAASNKAAKTPAAKKPRTTTTRKRTTAQKGQEDKRVPTVDELLQQPGYSLLPDTTTVESRSIIPCVENNLTEPDQTKSMEIAETEDDADQALAAQGSPFLDGTTTTRRMTRSASQALSRVPLQQNVKESNGLVKTAALPPCTPADQIISNPATPASPVAQAHTTAPPQPTTSLPHRREPQSSTLPVPATDTFLLGLHTAQQCLSDDPAFDLSSAQSRLAAWLKLPESTQTTTLRAYFCELIMTEGFSQLCKTVDMFWEGAILEGRMTMMMMMMMMTTRPNTSDPGSTNQRGEEEGVEVTKVRGREGE